MRLDASVVLTMMMMMMMYTVLFSPKAHMKWCLRHRISQPKLVSPQVQGYRITQGTTHSFDVYPGAVSIGTYLIRKVPEKQSCQHNNVAKELKCSFFDNVECHTTCNPYTH